MPSILITGSSGFIGSFLVEEGLQRNFTVYAGIRRSSSKKYLNDSRIQFVELDFSFRESLAETLSALKVSGIRFDYIVHNAGITKARRKEDFFRINTACTQHFVNALIETGMVPKKFLYMSSLAAYGPGNPGTMQPVSLQDEPHPAGMYGQSKLNAEKWIQSLDQFPYLIFRPTGVYGPREKDYFFMIQMIRKGLEPYIGSKDQALTFIYVKDLARLTYDALLSPVVQGAYFVSDGNVYSAEEFNQIVKAYLQVKTIPFVIPARVVGVVACCLEKMAGLWNGNPMLNRDKYRILISKNWQCDSSPLERDFGFHAHYPVQRGIPETIQWYRDHGWLN